MYIDGTEKEDNETKQEAEAETEAKTIPEAERGG